MPQPVNVNLCRWPPQHALLQFSQKIYPEYFLQEDFAAVAAALEVVEQ
jgi:hypothetical protein